MPTLLDLLGDRIPPPHLDGASLKPFLDGGAPRRLARRRALGVRFRCVAELHAESHFGIAARDCNLAVLRTEHFKYVHFGGGLPPLLFDLADDPNELRNLAPGAGLPPGPAGICRTASRLAGEHLDQSLALTELTEEGVAGSPARLGYGLGSMKKARAVVRHGPLVDHWGRVTG